MTDYNGISQLDANGMKRLFDESLPKWPGLTPEGARIAVRMHELGCDAATIADRIDMSAGAVLGFLDRLSRQRKPAPADERTAPELLEADHPTPVDDDATLGESAIAQTPASKPRQPLQDTRPDVDLTELQRSLIRRLRKTRVSASTIARMMRLSPDQVMRVAGEIP